MNRLNRYGFTPKFRSIPHRLFLFLSELLTPYGWPCVRGLFRFLTTLINNYDKYVFVIIIVRLK